ncbi:villin-1 isoform X2 [Phalaenopsis equestris]|uniref:villin-1 isoform X2 n=1 Tax=Phalaenopsis equestris TaxID=78828 RepID=UPI0009E36FAA|nr:villin-1 isoform X2 [Phalaenopsis equestris]
MWKGGVDEAFRGAGAKAGLEIWCIENLRPVLVRKSSHGKFFSRSAYIVLNTAILRNGIYQHDIHYWAGKDAEEDDSNLASDKALELDAALGSRAVHYKEVQGNETEKFLSYFKPCIIPIEGVFTSEIQDDGNGGYRVTLLACKGDHAIRVREVPFLRSSLNHNNVFILDTESKIFLFSGCNSSIQERAKALEVVQYINENQHSGRCKVATIEDGKFVGDSDAGEFWSFFGGYAPIPRESQSTEQNEKPSAANLFGFNKGKLLLLDSLSLAKGLLSSDRCYVLDCGAEIFLWMGRTTLVSERKASILAVEEFMHTQDRPVSIHTTFLTEGSETAKFKSYFKDWPQNAAPSLYIEGRGKVAAIFKHQGYDVKEIPEDDYQPIIDSHGILSVWRVNGHDATPLSSAEQAMLYRGDCYIVKYIYSENAKDNNVFYAWLGLDSTLEDQVNALSLMTRMTESIKGSYVMAQICEGKEPQLFFSIFQSLVILKGGLSSGYILFLSEQGITNETYDKDKLALFRVQGSSPRNMQAIQVDPVSYSLNSSYCYILQDQTTFFTWVGSLSSPRDHNLVDSLRDQLNPLKHSTLVREGNEPDIFWNVIGGKADYPKEKVIKEHVEDPHLFACILDEGDFKVKEIFNFTQDDLTTEDVLLLDCHSEIYVWVGQHASLASPEKAFTLGKKFLEADILLEGLLQNTAIYVIPEGNEPSFFTHYFDWDISKSHMHGNSFERKLAILKGSTSITESSNRGIQKTHLRYSSEGLFGHSSKKSTTSDGSLKGRGSAAPTGLSTSVSLNMHGFFEQTLVSRESNENTSPEETPSLSKDPMNIPEFESVVIVDDEDICDADNELQTYPYELLKVSSGTPLEGIDVTKREAYLSNEDFKTKFGMNKKAFYKLPKWKQNKLKQALNLF